MTDKFDHIFIAASDFPKLREFYAETLGWEVDHEWGTKEDGRGCALKSPGGMAVVIAEPHQTEGDQSWKSGHNGQRPTIHIATTNLDARFRQLQGKLQVVIPPEETHWGVRWFVVADPNGNLLAFTEGA